MKTLKILFASLIFSGSFAQAQKQTYILDADTANEVDDLFALVRAFSIDRWEVPSLNAVQWQSSQWAVRETMEESHRLNMLITGYLPEKERPRLYRGGHRRMYDWGDMAVHSAATYHILEQAELQDTVRIIALGALTNVASAVYIRPEIASKLEVYWLGSTYDFEASKIKFLDFNPMMDPQAIGLLMETQVRINILPVSELFQMTSSYAETDQLIGSLHPLGNYLMQNWFLHRDGGRKERILWDVALIELVLHPELGTLLPVSGVKNTKAKVYRVPDPKAILNSAMKGIANYLRVLPK